MLKYFISIIFVFTCSVLNAQDTTAASADINKKFSIKQLQGDLSVLKDSLQLRHPALYRFISSQSLDAAFQDAVKKINKPMTIREFYGITAPLIAKVGDIHTSIGLPDEYHNITAEQGLLFPFDVRIIRDEVFIASNNSKDSTIPAGARIIEINRQPVAKLLNRMQSYFSSDGYNQTFQLRVVEQRFAFHYLYAYGEHREFEVRYLEPGTQKSQVKKIAGVPYGFIKDKRTRNRQLYPKLKLLFQQPPYLSLSMDRGRQTAVLTIESLEDDLVKSSGSSFRKFIDSAFSVINGSKMKNLVIDIRNNGGGSSVNAGYLYSYLTNKPFRFLYAMGANPRAPKNDTIASQFFGLEVQQPQPNSFTGNVSVLIDGLTSSSAAQIAVLVRANKRGILIGEEAPGSLYGGSGRGYSYFRLAQSGLLVMISHYRLYMTDATDKNKHAPILPDYTPVITIDDLLNGIDKSMQFALKLININQ
jgi:hypothetical protein